MRNPNRQKKLFKLNSPIVYETENDGLKEIHEFNVWKPLAGQIKKVNLGGDLPLETVIELAADCSDDVTVPMLDLMEFEDLERLAELMDGFFSPGPRRSAAT